MASHPSAGRRTPKPIRQLPESQSKFDRWLEKQVEKARSVTFVFQHDPITGDSSRRVDCTVIAVDRYVLLLEFPDGQTFWTAKSNIISAGLPVNG